METCRTIVNRNIYPPQVLLKAAYAFIDDYYIHISENKSHWIIDYKIKSESKQNIEDFPALYENELIIQSVRLNVYQQTHSIRELLLARAMSSTIVDEEDPVDRIMSEQTDIDTEELDDILTDWFEKYD